MEINYSRKSVTECLEQAWKNITTNTRTFIRNLWIPILLIAVFSSLIYPTAMSILTDGPDATTASMLAALYLVNLICLILYNASFYKILNTRPLGYNLSRTFKLVCVLVPAILLVTAIVVGLPAFGLVFLTSKGFVGTLHTIVATIIMLFFVILFLVLMVPVSFVSAKFMIETDTKVRQLPSFYKRGMHHIPMLLGVTLLASLLVFTLSIIFTMPTNIIITANQISMLGVVNGDPSGMPANISYIIFAAMIFGTIVTYVLQTWFQLVMVHAYESIESRYRHDEEDN